MNLRKSALSIILGISIQSGAQIQDTLIHRACLDMAEILVHTALTDTSAYHQLRVLCRQGDRLPGSPQAEEALDWADSLMQTLHLDRVWRLPCPVPAWERGPVELAVLHGKNQQSDTLAVAALGGSVGTDSRGITAPVIEIDSWEELAEQSGRIAGHIVFLNRPMDPGIIETFSAYGRAVDQRVNGASRAAAHGALAVLVRSVTTKADDVPHVGTLAYRDGTPPVPAVAVGLKSADRLSRRLKQEPGTELTLTLSCRQRPDRMSSNLIAEIRGSERPEEIIVIGGHYDCWDKGTGAHDDGAGCLQSLEVLTLFKRLGIQPKRTIRCVFFMNEEFGLTGAEAYGAWAAASGEHSLVAIEADRGAHVPRGFFVTTGPDRLSTLQTWLPYLQKACIEWIRPGGSGGDVAQIQETGALFGYVPDIQRYFDFHHSENDQFSAIHPREMELGSAAMAILVYLISERGL